MKYWIGAMTKQLVGELERLEKSESEVDDNVSQFHHVLGWDAAAEDFVPSAAIAAGTWEESLVASSSLFSDMGIDDAEEKVRFWHVDMGDLHGLDSPLVDNVRDVIMECRDFGLKVAVCTSDVRVSTDLALTKWNVIDLIDYSVCADEVKTPKPSSDPLDILCERSNVKAGSCIVVGDTTADTGMARNAGAGFMIGVLTGAGTRDQLLSTGADVVLSDIGEVPDFLRSMNLCGQ
mmetsp:Transcript_43100/g.131257  ORF Transcript_43100/g.131257 Transcript_43100/m.131257 type:complete len:234 (-) Transcript_43100:413-1114(-)